MIDSHLHLDLMGMEAAAVMERAARCGVSGLVAVGTDSASSSLARDAAEAVPGIAASVGLHPHDASRLDGKEKSIITDLAGEQSVAAIGETGLDFHYDNSPRQAQAGAFRWHISLAERCGKALIVHSREAEAETMTILEEMSPSVPVIMHCFSGSPEMADWALARGYRLSFSGILTFPSAGGLRSMAARAPGWSLLVETDSPYLAPVPHRGEANGPWHLPETVRCLARERGEEPEAVAALTAANAREVFSIA